MPQTLKVIVLSCKNALCRRKIKILIFIRLTPELNRSEQLLKLNVYYQILVNCMSSCKIKVQKYSLDWTTFTVTSGKVSGVKVAPQQSSTMSRFKFVQGKHHRYCSKPPYSG
jgi:hypothetical protein